MELVEKIQIVNSLKAQIDNHGALSKEVKKKIDYKFRLEWNYTSNSMEGNTLTMDETRSVMVGNITVDGKPIKDVLEMKGHDAIISDILKIGKNELNISESRIKDIHQGIIHEDNPEEKKKIGVWKTVNNYIINYKGERIDFTEAVEVPDKMHQLINWLNAEKEKINKGNQDALHPVHLAFKFHLDYITIHPFFDGNGRTARILTNLILISYGYPPVYIKEAERKAYYQYLADIQGYGGAPDLFYEFMADRLIRSMQLVLDAIEGKEIEEEDDWEKKLSLLKSETSDREGIEIQKSDITIQEIIDKCVIPTLDKLIDKFVSFDDLFAERKMYLHGDNSGHYIVSKKAIHKLLNPVQDNYKNQIKFSYELNGYKKDGINTFFTHVWIKWYFDTFKYHLLINTDDNNTADIRLYHRHYTAQDINAIINQCANILVDKIRDQIKK